LWIFPRARGTGEGEKDKGNNVSAAWPRRKKGSGSLRSLISAKKKENCGDRKEGEKKEHFSITKEGGGGGERAHPCSRSGEISLISVLFLGREKITKSEEGGGKEQKEKEKKRA